MIRGIITARHIIAHPIVLISVFGVIGYLRLLTRCVDAAHHCFMDFFLLK